MSSAQSVPLARVIADSRMSAAPAVSGIPLREAASSSSTTAQLDVPRSPSKLLAGWAAVTASWYRPWPLCSTASAHAVTAIATPSPRVVASRIVVSISAFASSSSPRNAASAIAVYGARLLPVASAAVSTSAISDAAAVRSPANSIV
jgi:hypothetical protein